MRSTVVAFILLPAAAFAQGEIRVDDVSPVLHDSCQVYDESNFGGDAIFVPFMDPDGIFYEADVWLNDQISSVACGPGCRFEAYEHEHYMGASRTFADGYSTVYVGDDWNDRISSGRTLCGQGGFVPSAETSQSPLSVDSSPGVDCSFAAGTCAQGFVWREATPGDLVCVEAGRRDQVLQENDLAAERRAGAGASGPDTCLPGFVWREAFPGDVVCVPPPSRDQAAADNAAGPSRVACQG